MNKEIKIIDLLNMIAEGKERPNYIRYRDISKHKYNTMYVCKENIIYQLDQCVIDLNDTVEIIEDKKETYFNKDFMPVEEDNKITPQDVENLGYACNTFRKCFEKGWNKCEEDNNKIEKLTPFEAPFLTKDKEPDIRFRLIIDELNQIIDKINNME